MNLLPDPPVGKAGWPWVADTSCPYGIESWPRISIVTPSFNQATYIEATLRSVLLQGYPNLEYIVIDGGSTDGSVELIKKYSTSLTVWKSEPDNGQGDAIAKGFALASGEWLNWLNSDDVLLPGSLHRIGTAMRQASRSVQAFSFGCQIGNEDLSEVKETWAPSAPAAAYSFFGFGRTPVLPQPSTFVRRTSIGLFRALDYVMDWTLYVRIAAHHRNAFATDPNPVAKFRTHSAQKTATAAKSFLEEAIHSVATTDFVRPADRLAAWYWLRQVRGKAKLWEGAGLTVSDSLALLREFPMLVFSRAYWGHLRRGLL